MTRTRKKLVLAVIDGVKPSMLERAIEQDKAPALARIAREGAYVDECVSNFPSITPVCAATIATGVRQDEHLIPHMNWYHRGEKRYVEYGSSFSASRAFGVHRSLSDTIYNMNLAHLSPDALTVFESLDDADVRTAGTTFLIYRGRHRHEVSKETALSRLVTSTLFRHGVYGPRELFYADIFASRKTKCTSQLGLPGQRDQHTGCVGAHLVEHDLFDFMLFSLPDNDTASHKGGPASQVTSIAAADAQLARMAEAGGGLDRFLDDHAVIVVSDHSHAPVERSVSLAGAFTEWRVLQPDDPAPSTAHIAVCPSQRAAMLYVLDPEERGRIVPRLVDEALDVEGVDVILYLDGGEGVARSRRGELRFAPGGDLQDLGGARWSVSGELEALEAEVANGGFWSESYPDALARAWASLTCATAGDVQLSAAPGYEFVDWGGVSHVGGGSHGSLHRSDSLGVLLWCGTGPPEGRAAKPQWTLQDVAPMVRTHFGLPG